MNAIKLISQCSEWLYQNIIQKTAEPGVIVWVWIIAILLMICIGLAMPGQ